MSIEHTQDPKRYWHCWVYRTDSIPSKFFYGYAAQSHTLPTDTLEMVLQLESEDIVEHYIAPAPEDFEQFLERLEKGSLDLDILGFNLGVLPISYQQRSIQNTLGATAVSADSYYTFSANEVSPTAGSLRQMLGHLHHAGPYSEPERFMHRLGAFDIIHLPKCAEDEIPILDFRLPRLEFPPAKPRKRVQFEIERRADIAQKNHYAHVRLFCGDTVLSDAIYSLPAGCKVYGPVSSDDEFDRSQFWIFNNRWELVYHDYYYWNNSMMMTTSISGQSVAIEDALVESMKGVGDQAKVNKLKHVNVRSDDLESMTHFSTIHDFRDYQSNMFERGKAILKKHSHDRWFSKGPMGSSDAIIHIATLLDGNSIEEAWIVDPFFDVKALQLIAPRIGRRNLKLNVITSLSVIDPDTGEKTTDQDTPPLEILEQALPKLKKGIHCRLKVLNLLKREHSTRQAFHDRYICTKSKKEKATVYLLSNSLNSFMGDYPFCMSRMSGDAATALYEYIIHLSDKKDSASGKDLYCDFEWDSNEG